MSDLLQWTRAKGLRWQSALRNGDGKVCGLLVIESQVDGWRVGLWNPLGAADDVELAKEAAQAWADRNGSTLEPLEPLIR